MGSVKAPYFFFISFKILPNSVKPTPNLPSSVKATPFFLQNSVKTTQIIRGSVNTTYVSGSTRRRTHNISPSLCLICSHMPRKQTLKTTQTNHSSDTMMTPRHIF